MAIARDPVLEELRRSASLSASSSRKTSMGLAAADSTISLEGLEQADIDALVNRRWQIEEIIGLIRSRIAILSGGRDRRGAPIITIHGSEHSDFRPSNLAKLLSYLSKVADERLQGLGFTVVLDMRQTSWAVMKKALRSLQLTFVEHVHRVLLIKPRAFWQRQRAGVSFTLKKAKFNYPIVMLESSTDLFHHLQVSQVTRSLGGTLDYDHDQWIGMQRNLEKHQFELEGRLEEFEVLRDQLGQLEHLDNLNEARDAVRRHVEAKQRLDKGDLDTLCERVSHMIARMQPCDNPDFQACFGRLEDHCSSLQETRGRLERLWDEKGSQLDRILQLRLFEHDSEQLRQWIHHEAGSLAYNHTDIGDTVSTAELRRQAFEDFRARMKMKHHELSRVCTMGERLTAANHYATEVFKSHSKELKGSWENLSHMADERATLLSLSVSFHDRQQQFFQKVEGWLDDCMEKDFPEDVEKAEALLSKHVQLKETYQELYAAARQDGHKIIERLKRPVGEGSLPTPFVIGTRHVKEILESLFDERNWLDEQWQRRHLILTQALNLRKYQKEAKKVYTWLSDVGNPFLSSSNTIGTDANSAKILLRSHDQFEGDSHETYSLASQLFARAKELSASGECNPDMIEDEAESLESAVSIFATRLDERREIILHSQDYHNKMKALADEFSRLSAPVPHGQFNGSTSDVEPRLSSFLSSWSKVRSESSAVFGCCQDLVKRLKEAEKSAKSAGSAVNYSSVEEGIERRLEEAKAVEWKVKEVCLKREKRWKLTLQFNQLGPSVDKYLIELESWTQEQEHVEWEPAENTMDAQLHLDAFQRQYDTLLSSHDELVAMGRSVSKEIEQLDLEMFGSMATGHAHPLTSRVEQLIEKMKCSLEKMVQIASPKLQQLKDCLQYHLLQQRAKKLTMALTTLSFSLSTLNGVGHTLASAKSLNQQASDINDKLKGVGGDVDGFSHEVEDCISRQHYQAAQLGKLARTLQEKKGATSRHAMERHRVISASVEFQQNVKNLSASMDNCHAQFSSKETSSTVADNKRMLKNLEELNTFIEHTAEVVQSLGKKLLELIAETAATKTLKVSSPWQSPKDTQRRSHNLEVVTTLNRTPKSRRRNISSAEISGSPKLNRVVTAESAIRLLNDEDDDSTARPLARANSLDLLNSNGSDSVPGDSDTANAVVSRLDCPHSPRLLVTPRKAGVKSLPPSNHDQLMIEGVLHQMEVRLKELKEMWQKRQRRLKQSQKVVEFREAVPTVTEWVEEVGNKFLRGKHKHNLGRSIEEVKSLITEGEQFEQKEVVVIAEKVRQLQSMYKSVEEAGSHAFLNELRALNASLINKWEEFEKSLAVHMSNLDLSLKFQETLFEASNWCQKSQSFLNSMEEKGDVCDNSEEVASLVAELSVFINVTKTEQVDRVAKLKETSEYLRSNLLSEVAQQISLSTERTIGEFDSTKLSLEKLHSKLVQIEGEKDRERRLIKQRERVIEEILHTEEAYAADLKLVVEKCRPRFVSELLPPSLKGKENIIFANITDIEAFHRTHMLPRLQSLGADVDGVAQLFIENAAQLTALYVPFCRDKSAADDLLTSHRSYFDRIQFMFGTSTPLHSLLIKPVQRIAKYPLLMKEALKYTTELNQTSSILEEAVKAVEKILTVTNNAIHISCLENSKYLVRDFGELLYQSPLLVSEQSRFGIKGEKERHVFAFDRALLFARKVELGQGAKFKYEHKFNVPLNHSVKVIEFVEGERCKFILISGDQRLHFKASSLDIKQHWVTALRTAILADSRSKRSTTKSASSSSMAVTLTPHPPGQGGGAQENGWTRDLRAPSPSPSATDLNAPAAATKSEFERASQCFHGNQEVCGCVSI